MTLVITILAPELSPGSEEEVERSWDGTGSEEEVGRSKWDGAERWKTGWGCGGGRSRKKGMGWWWW